MERQTTTTTTTPSIIVKIPYGYKIKESNSIKWFHFLKLRELDGYDEKFIANLDSDLLPSVKTIALLKRVLSLLYDDIEHAPPIVPSSSSVSSEIKLERQYKTKADHDFISKEDDEHYFELLDITIGDRTVILLNLQKIMFGEIMHCEMCCQMCKKAVFIDIPISNLLQNFIEVSASKTEFEINIDNFLLKVRLPTTKDQEALISLEKNNNKNNNTAATMLDYGENFARSLILTSKPKLPEKLSEEFLNKLGLQIQKLESLSDILINIECHSCKDVIQTPFFIEDFIFKELSFRQKLFEQEIHWLALYYHWNEHDILSLSMKQRKRYVQLITRSLLGENDEW